jgi:adenylate kinase
MNVILLGAPGAGKGTQAKNIAEVFKIPHISTGDIFRINIKSGTDLGKKAKKFIDKGELVPDTLTIDIVKDRLKSDDCVNGFVLDGFPRTIPQAVQLDEVLKTMNTSINKVIDIHVEDSDIVTRLSGRRVCPKCGNSYHVEFNPTKSGDICDVCGTQVVQREDDNEQTVIKRLVVYHAQTVPLIEYYKAQGKLLVAHGKEKIEDTTAEVMKALGVNK